MAMHGKHKMRDMGEIRNTDGPVGASPESNKKEKHYPSISISSKQLPELKGKKYGDGIELHIVGEVGGIREDYNDKEEAEYEIKIKEAACGGGNVSKDEYDKMSEEEKDKEDEKEVMER